MALSDLFLKNQPPSAGVVRTTIALAAISYIVSLATEMFLFPYIDKAPEAIVALNPTNKNLTLVNGEEHRIDALPYYGLSFVRLLSSDPLYFLMGLWYGEKAIDWMGRKSRTVGRLLDEGSDTLRFFTYAMTFIAPATFICALAGTLMKFRTFLLINVAGTITTLITIRLIGNRFGGGIDSAVDFIAQYRWWVLLATVSFGAFTIYREFSGSKKSEMSMLRDLTKNDSGDGNPQ